MRRAAILAWAAVCAAAAFAQLGADRGSTNVVYYSSIHSAPARIKERITQRHDSTGYHLMDRKRVFAQLAQLVAEQVTVAGANEVAEAWKQGFSNGVESLQAAWANAPTNGAYLAVEIPYDPTQSRAAIDIYVVSNHYDSVTGYDLLWVYFNHELPKPTVEVPYTCGGETKRVAGTWKPAGTAANWTNVYTVVKGGYTYDNCHLLFVERPPEFVGAVMNLKRVGNFGNPETGISWGKVQTTYNGRPSITATLSDGTNDWEFVNGEVMNIKPTEQEDEE